MKKMLFTVAMVVMSLLAYASSAFACGALANQEKCPNELLK